MIPEFLENNDYALNYLPKRDAIKFTKDFQSSKGYLVI